MRPPSAHSDTNIISALRGTSGTITDHQECLVSKGSAAVGTGAFQPVNAPETICGHQADIRGQSPALLPDLLPSDSELTAAVEASNLPDEIKARILDLVRAQRV